MRQRLRPFLADHPFRFPDACGIYRTVETPERSNGLVNGALDVRLAGDVSTYEERTVAESRSVRVSCGVVDVEDDRVAACAHDHFGSGAAEPRGATSDQNGTSG